MYRKETQKVVVEKPKKNFSKRKVKKQIKSLFKSSNPYKDPLLNSLYASNLSIRTWRTHAFVIFVLYFFWFLIFIKNPDLEFSINNKSTSEIWGMVILTQFICWVQVYNTVSVGILTRKFLKAYKKNKQRVFLGNEILKCLKLLMAALLSSFGCYLIMSCYIEHEDTVTKICPVILFIAFSHVSSIFFKWEFWKRKRVLEKIINHEDTKLKAE